MPRIFFLLKDFFSKKKPLTTRSLVFITLLILGAVSLVLQMFLTKEIDMLSETSKSSSKLETDIEKASISDGIIAAESTPLPTPTVTLITVSPTTSPQQSTPTPVLELTPVAQITDLTNWKLTLPTGSAGSPAEIRQPQLATYQNDPFFVTSGGNSIRFRATVNGVTTKGSKYPRSELREMTNNGTTNASWSSTSGTHTLYLDQAITAVPQTKKHVVAGQIHDGDDDVIVIRLEYPKLYVNVDGKNVHTLDSNYSLGKRFTVKFVVNNGQTQVYYNGGGGPAYVLNKSYSGAYFKTGAYTQSNCSTEGSSSLCNNNNFGEVVVYQLKL